MFIAIVLSEYHSVLLGYISDEIQILFFVAAIYLFSSMLLYVLKSLVIKSPSTKVLLFNVIYSLVAVASNVPLVINPDHSIAPVWGYSLVGLNLILALFFILFNLFTIRK
jgi:hypothetical protein